MVDEFYRGKRVLVTGHTGFKGAWLCEWLMMLGAEVHGLALPPPTNPSLFCQLRLSKRLSSHTIGDIRNLTVVKKTISKVKPDVVFHLAAQPLVRLSYKKPVETFDTNVMGTINVMEAVRKANRNCVLVCITTDKVYENNDRGVAFKESDALGGYDPYSASKGACEVAIQSYRRAFFMDADCEVRIASARAGNVIGGGDWAMDRIVPDAMRAYLNGKPLLIRNRKSTRPWQHVLEPLSGYLMLGAWLREGYDKAKLNLIRQDALAFNFGPDPDNVKTVGALVNQIKRNLKNLKVEDKTDFHAPHEAKLLTLDSTKAKKILKWRSHWDFEKTIAELSIWYDQVMTKRVNPISITQNQIKEFMMTDGR